MQELPVYSPRGREHLLELDRKRDRLVAEIERRTARVESALRAIKLECVTENLRLTGVPVVLGEVSRVAGGEPGDSNHTNHEAVIRGQMAALDAIEGLARRRQALEKSVLLDVHRLCCPPNGGVFRRGLVRKPLPRAKPSAAEVIPEQIDNLMGWLAAQSVAEMHVVEKAAMAFTRLLEISPFETGNFRTAHLMINYFATAEDYPPLFFRFEEAAALQEDIERAMRFDTEPLVARLSEASARSLTSCLRASVDAPLLPGEKA